MNIAPEVLFFAISLLGQVLYFLLLRKDGAWLGWTMSVEGMAFAITFAWAKEIYLWIGWILLIFGVLITSYVLLKKEFLPNWANRILYHPKLNKL